MTTGRSFSIAYGNDYRLNMKCRKIVIPALHLLLLCVTKRVHPYENLSLSGVGFKQQWT
jgi:hypothetical protein